MSKLRIVIAALFAAAAALFAIGLASGTSGDAGPGTVQLRASVGRGGTQVELPPLGVISARTHPSPVTLSVRVDRVDVESLQRVLRLPDPGERLRRDVERDLVPLLRVFAVRSLGIAVVAGALAGALVPWRRWSSVVLGAASGALMILALGGTTWGAFEADAFREPRFEGPIERAPGILKAARRHVSGFKEVRRRLDTLAERVSGLYAATAGEEAADAGDAVRILHVSDIHSNPVGVELVRTLAVRFGVDAVLDTGDLTSFGLPIEARIGELIRGVSVPYLWVPGNHDSNENRASLAAVSNLHVLDGTPYEVEGVRILGIADPTFTAANESDAREATRLKRAMAPEVGTKVAAAAPHVLAVHDPVLAEAADTVPLVVAGHVHRRTNAIRDDHLVLTVGSTGATGLDSFTVRTELPYEAQILSFVEGRLESIDYVRLRGLGGNFVVERTVIDDSEHARSAAQEAALIE